MPASWRKTPTRTSSTTPSAAEAASVMQPRTPTQARLRKARLIEAPCSGIPSNRSYHLCRTEPTVALPLWRAVAAAARGRDDEDVAGGDLDGVGPAELLASTGGALDPVAPDRAGRAAAEPVR